MVRTVRREAGLQPDRQRLAPPQEAAQAVADNTDPRLNDSCVQRWIDDGLVEAHQSGAQVGVGRLVKERRIKESSGG